MKDLDIPDQMRTFDIPKKSNILTWTPQRNMVRKLWVEEYETDIISMEGTFKHVKEDNEKWLTTT